jgi:MinD-like ATPase involved in chromosome partitioning or flagellar assembly
VTVITVVGDGATTTAVAIASTWPEGDEVIVLEADPGGGSLAGWLDTPAHPSLATVVANAGTDATRSQRSVVETFGAMARRSDSGVRFVANAVRARAAHRAVAEADAVVFPALATAPFTVIADAGLHRAGTAPSPALRVADVVVVVHRQAAASSSAATVRIERLVEAVEELAHVDAVLVLAVIGRAPFDPAEIGTFVEQSVPDAVRRTVAIAEDPLAAATIAGRAGVSAKRLRRLPLMRSAGALASELSELVSIPTRLGTDDRPGREPASA